MPVDPDPPVPDRNLFFNDPYESVLVLLALVAAGTAPLATPPVLPVVLTAALLGRSDTTHPGPWAEEEGAGCTKEREEKREGRENTIK